MTVIYIMAQVKVRKKSKSKGTKHKRKQGVSLNKKQIPNFSKHEIDFFVDQCNFTAREKQFLYLSNSEETLESIAEKLDYSVSTANRISKRVKCKIMKVL